MPVGDVTLQYRNKFENYEDAKGNVVIEFWLMATNNAMRPSYAIKGIALTETLGGSEVSKAEYGASFLTSDNTRSLKAVATVPDKGQNYRTLVHAVDLQTGERLSEKLAIEFYSGYKPYTQSGYQYFDLPKVLSVYTVTPPLEQAIPELQVATASPTTGTIEPKSTDSMTMADNLLYEIGERPAEVAGQTVAQAAESLQTVKMIAAFAGAIGLIGGIAYGISVMMGKKKGVKKTT